MRSPASRFRNFAKKPTRKEGLANLTLFLCRARSLEGITAETLARRYPGVSLEEAEQRLAQARNPKPLF